MKGTFNHALTGLFLLILTGLVAVGYIARQNSDTFLKTSEQIELTNRILGETGLIDALDDENEAELHSYLQNGNASSLELAAEGEVTIFSHMDTLKTFVADDFLQRVKVDTLEYCIRQETALLDSAIALQKGGQSPATMLLLANNMPKRIKNTGNIIADIESGQRKLLQHQKETDASTISRMDRIFWLLLGASAFLLFFLFYAITRTFSLREEKEEEIRQLNTSLEQRVVDRTEELHESEKKYRHLFRNNPMPMWVIDEESLAFLAVNEAAEEHYGYSSAEFLSMTAYDIRPDDEKERLQSFDRPNADGPYHTGVWKHKTKDDRIIDVEVSAHKLLFEGKKARLVLSNDVTEKRIAEERLAASNHELSRIFNTVNEGLFSMDTINHKYNFVSAACQKIYGYPLSDFYANGRIWYEVIHPEDKIIVDRTYDDVKNGKRVNYEFRIIHKDTSLRWVKASVIPTLNEAGELVRIDGIISDITEQKRAEQSLCESEANMKAILNNTDTGYVLIDNSFRVLSFNHQADIFVSSDLRRPLEAGSSFLEYFPEEKRRFRQEMVQRVLNGEDISYESEYERADGTSTWYHIQMFNVLDEGKEFLGLTMAVSDITRRKLAELEIRSLNESLEKRVVERTSELQETNKELESFSYTVSHDLRAPLRIINGYGNILLCREKNALSAGSIEILGEIMTSAARMGQLIDDLLNFSKTGRSPLTKRPVNMNAEVQTVVTELKKSLNGSCRAHITLHELPSVPCDPNLLKQVWVNLISNAVKYSNKKSAPEVEIGSEESHGNVVYWVKDNGAGFDMAYADKLFGVFQRLHKISEFEGTGVGLALVHKIVTRHGGTIWAKAKEGEGATFYFTLS